MLGAGTALKPLFFRYYFSTGEVYRLKTRSSPKQYYNGSRAIFYVPTRKVFWSQGINFTPPQERKVEYVENWRFQGYLEEDILKEAVKIPKLADVNLLFENDACLTDDLGSVNEFFASE